MPKLIKILKRTAIAIGLSMLYWVLTLVILSNNTNFKSFRYMGF